MSSHVQKETLWKIQAVLNISTAPKDGYWDGPKSRKPMDPKAWFNGSKMDCAMAMGSDPVTGASMDGVVCHHGPATVCPEA